MNQLSLVDVQWSSLSLLVSLLLDCVKFRRKKWKRSFTIETPVHVRCCRAWQGRSQPAYTVLTKNAMLCPCVCFKPVTLFGVASILCQNFREGHTGISPYNMCIYIYIYIYIFIILPWRQIDHPHDPKAIPLTCSTYCRSFSELTHVESEARLLNS